MAPERGAGGVGRFAIENRPSRPGIRTVVYLLAVSLIWAFSFGLIGNALKGVDPSFVAAARLGIALAVFLPFLRRCAVPERECWKLAGCGAVQFGLMSVCYIRAYTYLPSHLVALFSVLTPLYVVLLHDLRRRRRAPAHLGAAALSVAGAAVIRARGGEADGFWTGFWLMQLAGAAFAFGQVFYRDWKRRHPDTPDHSVMGWLYAGGTAAALGFAAATADWGTLTVAPAQWMVLLFLGTVASGLGFFLWNKGAALSHPATLAACNNLVVPLAVFCSLFVFGEIAEVSGREIGRLLAGGTLIGASVWVAERTRRRAEAA